MQEEHTPRQYAEERNAAAGIRRRREEKKSCGYCKTA